MRLPRRSIPPITGLIAFEATARRLSFSRAAVDLALSQGAVSKRVRQLEDQLGITLLTRGGHQISLTQAGQRYLPEVQNILAQIDRTTRELQSNAGREQVLTVGTDPAFAIGWLLPRLADFNRTWPDVRIDVLGTEYDANTESANGLYSARDLDLTIRRAASGSAAVAETPLFPETLIACVGQQATSGQSDAELFESLPLLRHTATPELHDPSDADDADNSPSMKVVVDHCGVLISTAVHGHGIALVPSLLVRDDLRNGNLRQIGKCRNAGGYVVSIGTCANGIAEARGFYNWLVKTARRYRKLSAIKVPENNAWPPGRPKLAHCDDLSVGR